MGNRYKNKHKLIAYLVRTTYKAIMYHVFQQRHHYDNSGNILTCALKSRILCSVMHNWRSFCLMIFKLTTLQRRSLSFGKLQRNTNTVMRFEKFHKIETYRRCWQIQLTRKIKVMPNSLLLKFHEIFQNSHWWHTKLFNYDKMEIFALSGHSQAGTISPVINKEGNSISSQTSNLHPRLHQS